MTDSETGSETGSRRTPIISIVGLGRVGLALGLALQRVKTDFEIWGHDRDHARGKAAGKAKAVDKASWNLIEVAEAADLLFVTEPLEQLAETLEVIAPHVRSGSLITDTAGTKTAVMALADRLVPDEVSFVGGHPIPHSATADEASLLTGAAYCLVPAPGASEKSVEVLTGLVSAIGAQPYFIGAEEHDALVAGVHHLPYLLSSVFHRVIDASPSARDLHRLSPGAAATGVLAGADGAHEREAVMANNENVLVWLDQALADLVTFRDALSAGDSETLSALLEDSDAARVHWGAGEIQVDDSGIEELRDINPLRDMIFGRGFRRKKD